MADQDEKKNDSKETPRPTNAATEFGLEDHIATQQDPRVAALKKADDARRLSTQSGRSVRRATSQHRAPVTPQPQVAITPTLQTESVPVTEPESQSMSPLPHYESRIEPQPHSDKQPYNAATDFGLEDTRATAQDPRVERIMKSERRPKCSRQKQHRKRNLHPLHHLHTFTAAPPLEKKEAALEATQPKPENPNIPAPPLRPEDVRMPPPTIYSSGCVTGACPLPGRGQPRGKTTCSPACGLPCRSNPIDEWKDPEDEPDNNKRVNTDYTIDPSKEFTRTRTSTKPLPDESENVSTEANDVPATKKPLMHKEVSESHIAGTATPKPYEKGSLENSGSDMALTETPSLTELFKVASKQVKAAGVMALEANKVRQEYTTKKHDHDILTRTDNEVEEKFIREMSARYPSHKFIGEEAISKTDTGQVELTDEPTWIIDPIDGTMNYVHRFPYYCISVALIINKQPEFGIIYNPPMNEMYTARRGKGAYLNDSPIRTSGQKSLEHSLVLQEYSTGINEDRNTIVLSNTERLLKKTHAMRSIGSSAMGLAMVASGVADAFYYFGLHIWHMAAGVILVQEAGGVVIDPAGGELDLMSRRCLAAASMPLARELSDQLDQSYPSPRDDQPISKTPKVETKDFIAQTDFTDSSDSLVSSSESPTRSKPPVTANQ
ncbi:GL24595 [Drosophila persimilis]|uniref:inositol-phosphate phosphatase n=1 Tax=Drosophila persimilis TaxID=7234 RepID=B4H5Z0_DROPE|nr:GL24595 [Drosophila persimilis]